MPSARADCDVAVLGAGLAGLLTARRLSAMGYRVAVIDPSNQALAGASSRNEGWLHAGTYHSVSIAHLDQATTVARRCIYGGGQIQREFPECVEPEHWPAVAVVREDRAPDVISRWQQASVSYSEVKPYLRAELSENVRITSSERLFAVADRSIDVRILGARLVGDLYRFGARMMMGSQVKSRDEERLLVTGRSNLVLHPRLTVLATGYATSSVCAELGLPAPKIRLWQSHLAIIPQLALTSVFGIAPGEAAMVNHGSWSVVGQNEDATLVPEPTFDPRPESAEKLLRAVRNRFKNPNEQQVKVTSCVKVDVQNPGSDARSLNVQVAWLTPRTVSILPGKMTEAPFAADYASHEIFARLQSPIVTGRPLETHKRLIAANEGAC